MNTISISRRRFAHLIGAGAAAAVFRPALSFSTEEISSPASNGIVRLSSNENPYGPSPKALQAMTDAFGVACRYPDEQADLLVDALAQLDGVSPDQILLGDGSGEILKLCAAAFTGPANGKNGRGKLVVADPTFEAILAHAKCGRRRSRENSAHTQLRSRSSQDAGRRERRAHLHLQSEQSDRQHYAEEGAERFHRQLSADLNDPGRRGLLSLRRQSRLRERDPA